MKTSHSSQLLDLLNQAKKLSGIEIGKLTKMAHFPSFRMDIQDKGQVGQLLEKALGASAGNKACPDFETLGVELKTIPLDVLGRVRESTYVCYINLTEICHEEWETSHFRRKICRVLWIPIQWDPKISLEKRRIGNPVLWSPSTSEETLLKADWTMLVGCIAIGGVEEITAHRGEALQIRPKGKNSASRVRARDEQGIPITAGPRGFYLRAWFTERLLWRGTDRRCPRAQMDEGLSVMETEDQKIF